MLVFDTTPNITKQLLLKHNTQETYLEHYLGIPVKKGLFKSPLRHDNTPTCSFYMGKQGDIIFKDFSGDFSGDFINVVMRLHGCSYYKALNIIANDFGIINKPNLPKTNKQIVISNTKFEKSDNTMIQIESQDFKNYELDWWKQYNIDLGLLNFYKVFSCKTVFLNGEIFSFSSKHNLTFGYYEGKDSNHNELWRIYFPNKKNYRFISNWKASVIQGYKQLPPTGHILIITKSLKDVMTLKSFGVNAIAPCSENLFISDKQLEKLQARFKQIYLFYDNDYAGITNMNKIRKKYNVKCLWIPRKYGVKDISDYCKRYGVTETNKLIRITLNGGK